MNLNLLPPKTECPHDTCWILLLKDDLLNLSIVWAWWWATNGPALWLLLQPCLSYKHGCSEMGYVVLDTEQNKCFMRNFKVWVFYRNSLSINGSFGRMMSLIMQRKLKSLSEYLGLNFHHVYFGIVTDKVQQKYVCVSINMYIYMECLFRYILLLSSLISR